MHNSINDIVCKISQDNTIFGSNAFYLSDSKEFVNNGIDDKYINMFYIRPVNLDASKFAIVGNAPIYMKRQRFRAVFQLSKKIDKVVALESLLNQLMSIDQITVVSYSDDNNGIYKGEHGKDKEVINSNLLAFDFDFYTEFMPANCDCLTLQNCAV